MGFFAIKPERAHRELKRYPSLVCVGTVSLSGRVVQHENGYRAETVQIDELWVVESKLDTENGERAGEVADRLMRRYRCEARVGTTLRAATHEAARTLRQAEPASVTFRNSG